jgi:hypothetical protein
VADGGYSPITIKELITMKKTVLLVSLIVASQCQAGQFWSEDKTTNGLIIASNVLTVVDCAQTMYGANRPDQYEEVGWAENFIGRRPTSGDVTRYCLAVLAGQNIAGYFLPERATFLGLTFNPKKILYFGITAIEVDVVISNYHTGVKLEF